MTFRQSPFDTSEKRDLIIDNSRELDYRAYSFRRKSDLSISSSAKGSIIVELVIREHSLVLPTETSTQDSNNIGKTSDTQKANPNSLNMSLTKDMK